MCLNAYITNKWLLLIIHMIQTRSEVKQLKLPSRVLFERKDPINSIFFDGFKVIYFVLVSRTALYKDIIIIIIKTIIIALPLPTTKGNLILNYNAYNCD